MNYDSHIPEKNPDHKDVAPATQSVSHVPFLFPIPQVRGIINNATTTETQKDISVVKLNFRSAVSSPAKSAGCHVIMCCPLLIK